MKFKDIDLHDAVLNSIQIDWLLRNVEIIGITFGEKSTHFKLQFSGVSFTQIPHKEEWGESNSINELTSSSENEFSIEMQSGDIISIQAKGFNFEKNI